MFQQEASSASFFVAHYARYSTFCTLGNVWDWEFFYCQTLLGNFPEDLFALHDAVCLDMLWNILGEFQKQLYLLSCDVTRQLHTDGLHLIMNILWTTGYPKTNYGVNTHAITFIYLYVNSFFFLILWVIFEVFCTISYPCQFQVLTYCKHYKSENLRIHTRANSTASHRQSFKSNIVFMKLITLSLYILLDLLYRTSFVVELELSSFKIFLRSDLQVNQ